MFVKASSNFVGLPPGPSDFGRTIASRTKSAAPLVSSAGGATGVSTVVERSAATEERAAAGEVAIGDVAAGVATADVAGRIGSGIAARGNVAGADELVMPGDDENPPLVGGIPPV